MRLHASGQSRRCQPPGWTCHGVISADHPGGDGAGVIDDVGDGVPNRALDSASGFAGQRGRPLGTAAGSSAAEGHCAFAEHELSRGRLPQHSAATARAALFGDGPVTDQTALSRVVPGRWVITRFQLALGRRAGDHHSEFGRQGLRAGGRACCDQLGGGPRRRARQRSGRRPRRRTASSMSCRGQPRSDIAGERA